jgi:hypothetical protein
LEMSSQSVSEYQKYGDPLSKLDNQMNQIIKNSLKKSEALEHEHNEDYVIKKVSIYPKLMEIRYEYFNKLNNMLKKNRTLGFENIYESETPISEMKLSKLKQGVFHDIGSKYEKITCVATDCQMRMVAYGTKDGELIIQSTKKIDFFREEISREKGGKGKNMRRIQSGEIDFITCMHFWSDPEDLQKFNESFGL